MGISCYDAVDGTLRRIPPKRRGDRMVREAVRRAVRAAVNEAWGKRPIVQGAAHPWSIAER